jgi:hypothetical protein
MTKRILTVGLALFLLASVPRAFGQVGLYAGFFGGYSSQKPSLPTAIFNTDTTFCYGVRVGLNIMMIGIEGTYFQAAHNIDWESGLFPDWNGREVDYNYIGVNLKYAFPLAMIRPYLTVGYGYYSVDIWNIDKANDGGYNFGAGLEVVLGKRFGLVVEGKYNHANLKLDLLDLDLGLGDFTVTGGLNIYLF